MIIYLSDDLWIFTFYALPYLLIGSDLINRDFTVSFSHQTYCVCFVDAISVICERVRWSCLKLTWQTCVQKYLLLLTGAKQLCQACIDMGSEDPK